MRSFTTKNFLFALTFSLLAALSIGWPSEVVAQVPLWSITCPAGTTCTGPGDRSSKLAACASMTSVTPAVSSCPAITCTGTWSEAADRCNFSSPVVTCGNGATAQGCGQGAASVSYSCPSGQTYSGGRCVTGDAACTAKVGTSFTGQVLSVNGETCPTKIVATGGCEVKIDYCATVNGADGKVYWELGGTFSGQSGSANLPVGQSVGTNTPRNPTSTASSAGNTSTSGTGSTGGGTSGFGTTDATNLARIATNTATTINAVDRNTAALNQQLNRANSTLEQIAANTAGIGESGGGSCGGSGQPACKIDETGTPTATALAAEVDSLKTGSADALKGITDHIATAGNGVSSGSFLFGSIYTLAFEIPQRSSVCSQTLTWWKTSVVLDACQARDTIDPFLRYAVWFVTALAAFAIAFGFKTGD